MNGQARILVVDDEATHMQALCAALQDRGYHTVGCRSGAEALAQLEEQSFDLLLTDLMMPGMDGVALLGAALKADPHLAAVLMTGMGTIETAVQAMQAGALDYILKPFRISALLPVVVRALGVRKLRMENVELRSAVAIHELNHSIAHAPDTAAMLAGITTAACAQFEADQVSVLLVAEESSVLEVASISGEGCQVPAGTRINLHPALESWLDAEARAPGTQDTAMPPGLDTVLRARAAVALPMLARNRLVGVLCVGSERRTLAYTSGQLRAMHLFTNAAAAGIEAGRLHEAQRRADGRYREVLNMVADAVISCDEQLRIIVFNDGARAMFGHEPEEVLGRSLDILLPNGVEQRHRAQMQAFLDGPELTRVVAAASPLLGKRRDGSLFPIEAGISKRLEGDKALFTAVVRDITERQQQEQRIARLTRLYAVLSAVNGTIVRSSSEPELFTGICNIVVEQGGLAHARIYRLEGPAGQTRCVACKDAAGYAPEPCRDEAGAADHVLVGQALQLRRIVRDEAVAVLPFVVEDEVVAVMVLHADTPSAFGEEEQSLLKELAGDVAFALDHIEKTSRMSWLATHDLLTGLPNRALFADRLGQAVTAEAGRQELLAVVLLDIERFRHVNDTFGRHGGDELLRQLAARLQVLAGDRNTLARTGPDVFAMLYPRCQQASDVAKAVRACLDQAMAEPFILDGRPLRLAARAGLAFFPADGRDADELVKNAEAALQRAKVQRERMSLYTADLNARVAERLTLESKLRGALERGEFLLHYQPKVDLASGAVVGLEALLRWHDPDSGLVPPDQFIGLLEDMGIILQVGQWVMQEAAHAAATLHGRGHAVRIAVNVSPLQLRDDAFVAAVEAAIGGEIAVTHGLDLEITESLIMQNIGHNVQKLQALRRMGIGLAIDDFGTGYSSLAYIARLPVQHIKIDRAFIRNLGDSAESIAIVQAIISLAQALNMKVIAEGVETQEQADVLRHLGCNEAQGFLFSRAVPLEEVGRLLVT